MESSAVVRGGPIIVSRAATVVLILSREREAACADDADADADADRADADVDADEECADVDVDVDEDAERATLWADADLGRAPPARPPVPLPFGGLPAERRVLLAEGGREPVGVRPTDLEATREPLILSHKKVGVSE